MVGGSFLWEGGLETACLRFFFVFGPLVTLQHGGGVAVKVVTFEVAFGSFGTDGYFVGGLPLAVARKVRLVDLAKVWSAFDGFVYGVGGCFYPVFRVVVGVWDSKGVF